MAPRPDEHHRAIAVDLSLHDALSEALNADPGFASNLVRMNEAQQDAHRRWAAAAKAQLDAIDQALTRLEAAAP